jgi:ABC-type glycerol-3-phosphate transport system substrate-binding protein
MFARWKKVGLLVSGAGLCLTLTATTASARPSGSTSVAWVDAVNRVLNGQQTPRQALDQAQREAQAAIDKAK